MQQHNPGPTVESKRPADYSPISRMFADWCAKQGAKTEINYDQDGVKYVHACLGDYDFGNFRSITAAFDELDGRFLRDGAVGTECEFGSATTLKELANALLTGHRDGKGHR